MSTSHLNPIIANIKSTQSHPFHVLSSSKLPILIATFAGLLALTFIAKLHSIDYAASFEYSVPASYVLSPYFSTATGLNYLSINAAVLTFVVILTLLMGS
jgi:hypothetical protein